MVTVLLAFVCMLLTLALGAVLVWVSKTQSSQYYVDQASTYESEPLRKMVADCTGREISHLMRMGGQWYAHTSKGYELVSNLLKETGK